MTPAQIPAPVVVFDVRDHPAWDRILADRDRHQRLLAWMRSQGLDPRDVYRLEVHLMDPPSARVYEYARDEEGHRYCGVDHDHRRNDAQCRIARRDPYDVPLSSLPPEAREEVR